MRKTTPFIRLLRLALPFWRAMVLAALAGAATIASSVGLLSASAYIIAFAALHPSIAVLQTAIVGVRFFGISRGALRYVERLQAHDATFRLLAGLRMWFFEQLEPLAPAGLIDQHGGDLLARFIADVESLEDFYVRVLAPPVVALATVITLTAVYTTLSPRLAIAILLLFISAGAVVPAFAAVDNTGEARVQLRADRQIAVLESISGCGEIIANGRGAIHMASLKRLDAADRQLELRAVAAQGGSRASILVLRAAAVAVGLIVLIPIVHQDNMNGLLLAVVTLATLASFEAVAPLGEAFQHLRQHLAAARRLFALADTEPAIKDPPASNAVPTAGLLEIRQLSFGYVPGEALILDHINLRIQAGTATAIIGPSGSGKSTLANLLLRFWDYQQGTIRIGEHDLRTLQQDDVRSFISAVPQEINVFYGTLRENLLLARPEACEGDLQLALRLSQLQAFVRSLPAGLDTHVGEGGMLLSGGERQRLALAQAFLKNAPFFLLDEPESHLDEQAQRGLLEAFRSEAEGRTVIWITHRLHMMPQMDQVVVLQGGRIAADGQHADLLKQGGIYARMWELERQSSLLDGAAGMP